MSKLNVWYGHAHHLSSKVLTGNFDLAENQGYKVDGMKITLNHQFLIVEPYGVGDFYMPCFVMLRPNWLDKLINLLTFNSISHPRSKDIKKKTKIRFDRITTVNFDNGFDDSCYSFKKENK